MLPRWNYWWLRYPRTQQERNRNTRPEEREFVRLKRTKRRLPTSWEDIFLPYKKNESWKRLRRTQYKTKPLSAEGHN